jgi:arabinan endo-1,5-alpha-L-arabinosidase
VSLGDGSYKLINQQSYRALDDYDTSNASEVYIWDFVYGIDQKWNIYQNGDGSYRLINVKSGLALDDYNYDNGSAAYVWQYVSGNDQNWTLYDLN